jgi:hypothetical protein
VVEYRDPEYQLGVWLRPRAPQRGFPFRPHSYLPVSRSVTDPPLVETVPREEQQPGVDFTPLRCSYCSELVRGSRFQCVRGCVDSSQVSGQRPVILCETCARGQVHPPDHLKKMHKNCILAATISDPQARQICSCWESPTTDIGDKSLYPFTKTDRGRHDPGCHLLNLKSKHCQEKLDEVVKLGRLHDFENSDSVVDQPPSEGGVLIDGQMMPTADAPPDPPGGNQDSPQTASASVPRGLISMVREKLSGVGRRIMARPVGLSSMEPLRKQVLQQGMRLIKDDIPFGNVHMGLVIGPLIIENGVPE